MRCRLHVKKYGRIDLKHLLQFPDQPSPILGSTENTTFVHLPKKSKFLKADFFVISSTIVLASEWTTSRNQGHVLLRRVFSLIQKSDQNYWIFGCFYW